MKEKKTSSQYASIAGILFAAAAVMVLLSAIGSIRYIRYWGFTGVFSRLLELGGCAAVSFALLGSEKLDSASKRNYVLLGGFACLLLKNLLSVSNFISIFALLAWAGASIIAAILLTDQFPQYRETARKVWFVPAICMAVTLFFSLFYYSVSYKLFYLCATGGILLTMLHLTSSIETADVEAAQMGEKAQTPQTPLTSATRTVAPSTAVADAADACYCSLVKHILLLLFTFGIWQCIWVYRMTGYTNAVQDEEPRNPTNKLLLCLFVPFYLIYWTYKTAQRVDKMAAAKGLSSDLATMCLILEIFVPIIPPIMLQDKINSIVTADSTQNPVAQSAAKKSSAALGTAEELKTYKELLDSGVITQEEFDAKKNQLLGL